MKPHVLLIEGEPGLRDVLSDNLEHEGYRVSTTGDGHEALTIWPASKPDLVVLDVMLPGLSGFEICERMRRTGDVTPVLFLRARSQAGGPIRGLSARVDDYLATPNNRAEFLRRVGIMPGRRRW